MEIAAAERPATYLKDGATFKESLRDGRQVWIAGRRVDDVTLEPSLGPGIDLIAETFDDQFNPELEDLLTFVDEETGERFSRSWQIPRTVAELQTRRKVIEYCTLKTFGTFGRPPDHVPLIALGLLARQPLFEESNPEFAGNITRYFDYGRKNSLIAAEVIVDPQTDRSKPVAESPGLLRVTSRETDGVRVSGAKSVASISAQGNEVIFSNLVRPGLPPESCIWAALPLATDGIMVICREGVSRPGADPYDHPIASRGEESDQLLIYDNVLIPNDRVFNVGDPELLKLYGPVMVFGAWHILARLWTKAEIFVGIGQLVADSIGTSGIPGVRAHLSDLICYAQALRAFVIAAENLGTLTEGGVMAPDMPLLTAGRLYSIEQYPRIIHLLQELCGQGLVMRFSRADFDSEEIGPHLARLLPGHEVSAREKNQIMNFMWDLTTDSHAGRTTLFENVNALPAPLLKERLYAEFPRDHLVDMARDLAGLPYGK